jgi:hypothetical protein
MSRFGIDLTHNGRPWYAVLDENGDPVPCDLMTWSNWFAGSGQRIFCQEMIAGY